VVEKSYSPYGVWEARKGEESVEIKYSLPWHIFNGIMFFH
jgi:hypothetical protein